MASYMAISLTQLSASRCMCVRLCVCVCVHVLWRNQERVLSVQLLHVLCFSSRLSGGSKVRTCEVYCFYLISVVCWLRDRQNASIPSERRSAHTFSTWRGSAEAAGAVVDSGHFYACQRPAEVWGYSKSLWWSAWSLTEGFDIDSLIEGQHSHSLATTSPDTWPHVVAVALIGPFGLHFVFTSCSNLNESLSSCYLWFIHSTFSDNDPF